MNYYQEQRREKILSLLDPMASTSELVDSLSEYIDGEVRKAYGRGLQAGQQPQPTTETRYEVQGKPTAIQAGKIKRVQK